MSATACTHGAFIRYVLDASAASHAQRDGVDDRGRPYRDVPMLPRQTFAYAVTIGSTFESRVVEATCRTCGADVLDTFHKELS